MNARDTRSEVLFEQRLLRSQGLYEGALDGIWGPRSQAARERFEDASRRLREQLGTFDMRSEAQLQGLALPAQRQARLFLQRMHAHPQQVRVISGTRSYVEQAALYRLGRFGRRGPVVTRARAGQSAHNFGIAWDIGVFDRHGHYLTDAEGYELAARLGLTPELEWGGHWPRFRDLPHYQLAMGEDIASIRQRFESGHAPV